MMRKNLRTTVFGLLALIGCPSIAAHAQTGMVVHDLSSGVVNGTTTLIAPGTQDDTWQLAFPSSPSVFHNAIVCLPLTSWDSRGCGRWLTNKLDISTQFLPFPNSAAGEYRYRTVFNLDYSCYPWAKVNFSYVGADNNIVGLSINGHDYAFSPPTTNDFQVLTQNVSINIAASHLVVGTNELIVKVNNSEGYTGFFACGNVTVGYCGFRSLAGQADGISLDPSLAQDQPALLKIVPNPSNGHLSLKLEQPREGSAEIWDMMGRRIWQTALRKGTTSYPVDLSGMPKGIYSVMIRTEGVIHRGKIILQ